MRCSTFLVGAFAAAAMAGPLKPRQDDNVYVDVVTHVVDVTDIVATVTVTAGQPAGTPTGVLTVTNVVNGSPSGLAPPSPTQWTAPASSSAAQAPPSSSAAPASSAAPSSGSSGSSGSTPQAGLSDWQNECLGHTNIHRGNHSASPVTYDSNLESQAQAVAAMCNSEHQMNVDGGNYGQNYFFASYNATPGQAITDGWYNGEEPNFAPYYGQATPSSISDGSVFDTYGHFTQLVWQATDIIGCAVNYCESYVNEQGSSDIPYFFVCNYRSTGSGDGTNGNMEGAFNTNVAQPQGQPTWSSSDNDFS